jgi:hypothetical protein
LPVRADSAAVFFALRFTAGRTSSLAAAAALLFFLALFCVSGFFFRVVAIACLLQISCANRCTFGRRRSFRHVRRASRRRTRSRRRDREALDNLTNAAPDGPSMRTQSRSRWCGVEQRMTADAPCDSHA